MGWSILQRGVRVFRCAKNYSQSRWCSSKSAIGSLPLLMLPPSCEGGGKGVTGYNLYSPAMEKVISIKKRGEEYDRSGVDESRVVGSSHGWVALFNEKREDGDLFLWEPVSGRQIKLPPLETLPDAYPKYNYGRASVTKVIISCSPDEQDDECGAMMIYGGGERLAFCRPFSHSQSPKWTRIGDLRYEEDGDIWGRSYQEFVYSTSQKLFFCVTKNGEMEAWDHSPKLQWRAHLPKQEEEEEEYSGVQELNYLVFDEQSAQLLLVKRHVLERMGPDGTYVKEDDDEPWETAHVYPHKTIAFDVHRVDLDNLDNNGGARLSRPRPTAGLSIFLGKNHSFAITATHQLKPNSIYFTDPFPGGCMCETDPFPEARMYGGHDIGVFNYENRTLSPCYYPCHVSTLKRIMPPPFWFTPTANS